MHRYIIIAEPQHYKTALLDHIITIMAPKYYKSLLIYPTYKIITIDVIIINKGINIDIKRLLLLRQLYAQ